MILRRPLLSELSNLSVSISQPCTRRTLHHQIPVRPIPKPIPFIPDVPTFLSAIGRNLSAHSAKIPSWDALFTLSSSQLKDVGIEPARSRKYLLHWREKYRNGEFGIGGDCAYVSPDGTARLRLVEAKVRPNPWVGGMSARASTATATHDPGTRNAVINVPEGWKPVEGKQWANVRGVRGVVVKPGKGIKGSHVEVVGGSGGLEARIRVKEGIWEVRRGHKVDGGERRRAEVRAKRRAAENKER